jgi:tetratricopeptide (TPR) repeat protein
MAELLSELEFALPPLSPPPAGDAPVASLALARAERAAAHNRPVEALAALRDGDSFARDSGLAFRALLVESWSSLSLGALDEALGFALRANELAAGPDFTDLDRANALYHLGCCRFKMSEVAVAVSLLTLALDLCDRSRTTCDRLRANILEWRSRCHQRTRDWNAARNDVELALELAAGLDDRHTSAHAYFQAAVVAERTGDQRMARFYAEEAEAIYRAVDDRLMLARIKNNLGCLLFLEGDELGALLELEDAIRLGLELGAAADVAQATASVAQIHLRRGRPELAEEQARNALGVLDGRVDFLDEIGGLQIVLGRALLEQQRFDDAAEWLATAEQSFSRLGSTSHVAAAWVAQGDLARARGNCSAGADLYRRAAEALQDFHF